MEKIVDLRKHIEGRRREEQLDHQRARIEAIQRLAQCSACLYRCAMCGMHVNITDTSEQSELSSRGIALCPVCTEEFEAYLSRSKDKGRSYSGSLWQNEAWMNMWEAWLGYRQALMDFIHSPEFREVLEELDR